MNLQPMKTDKGVLPACILSGEKIDECTRHVFKHVQRSIDNAVPIDNPMKKSNEYTYVYDGYVYKYFNDMYRANDRVQRADVLRGMCPNDVVQYDHWLRYEYVPGDILTDRPELLVKALDWLHDRLWLPTEHEYLGSSYTWSQDFYLQKTLLRIARYDTGGCVAHQLNALNWGGLAQHLILTRRWHGDCSFENIICRADGSFAIIDWREDDYGDVYYDLAKMLKSIYFKHDTVAPSGIFFPHANCRSLECMLRDWCLKHFYNWEIVDLICAIAFLAMSGSHDGQLGQNFFTVGKTRLANCRFFN